MIKCGCLYSETTILMTISNYLLNSLFLFRKCPDISWNNSYHIVLSSWLLSECDVIHISSNKNMHYFYAVLFGHFWAVCFCCKIMISFFFQVLTDFQNRGGFFLSWLLSMPNHYKQKSKEVPHYSFLFFSNCEFFVCLAEKLATGIVRVPPETYSILNHLLQNLINVYKLTSTSTLPPIPPDCWCLRGLYLKNDLGVIFFLRFSLVGIYQVPESV